MKDGDVVASFREAADDVRTGEGGAADDKGPAPAQGVCAPVAEHAGYRLGHHGQGQAGLEHLEPLRHPREEPACQGQRPRCRGHAPSEPPQPPAKGDEDHEAR